MIVDILMRVTKNLPYDEVMKFLVDKKLSIDGVDYKILDASVKPDYAVFEVIKS